MVNKVLGLEKNILFISMLSRTIGLIETLEKYFIKSVSTKRTVFRLLSKRYEYSNTFFF